jgi:hypothetical protein
VVSPVLVYAVLASVHFRHSEAEEKATDQKSMEILANSPYKDLMQDGALFIQVIQAYRDRLTGLITPTHSARTCTISQKKVLVYTPSEPEPLA